MARGRVPDSEMDVYGDFVVRVMNSIRQAEKHNMAMNEEEYEIVLAVKATLLEMDPEAEGVVDMMVRVADREYHRNYNREYQRQRSKT